MIGMKEVFDILSAHTGLPTIKTILPAGIGKMLGRMSDIAEKLTRKPQRMTSFAVYNLVRNNEFDSSKAVAELGYNPRPMAQSIAEEIEWMIDEGIVPLPEPAPADERSLGQKFIDANVQFGETLAAGFTKMSEGVVSGYKAVETGVVKGCTAIEDGFVEHFLMRPGETLEDAKARLKKAA